MKQLYYCPKKTAFASGINNKQLVTCFPLGNVLGISYNTIQLSGIGTLGLKVKGTSGHYQYLPWGEKGRALRKEVMDDLTNKLEQHLGKR